MFTGIVETVGRVVSVEGQGDGSRLVIDAPEIVASVGLGDSIAVNGACLTLAIRDGKQLHFDAVRETLDCTALGDLEAGSAVNIERAMRADARLDGHIVQGHVDATGRVARMERRNDDVQLFLDCSSEFAELLVPKGSVTVDGVSLTVVGVAEAGLDIALIPHTLEVTTLGGFQTGRRVNLEADILGKYVRSYLERLMPKVPANG
jgi:riboflavin synthase